MHHMKSLLIILFIFVFFGCHGNRVELTPLSASEYEVYGFLIDSVFNTGNGRIYFVNDSTLCNNPKPSRPNVFDQLPIGRYTPNDLGKYSQDWREFNVNQFETLLQVQNGFRQRINIDSIKTNATLKRIEWFDINQSQYKEPYSKGQIGFVWFSRVVFSAAQNECLVYSEFACGFTCGYGSWFWLKKVNGNWKVQINRKTWVS